MHVFILHPKCSTVPLWFVFVFVTRYMNSFIVCFYVHLVKAGWCSCWLSILTLLPPLRWEQSLLTCRFISSMWMRICSALWNTHSYFGFHFFAQGHYDKRKQDFLVTWQPLLDPEPQLPLFLWELISSCSSPRSRKSTSRNRLEHTICLMIGCCWINVCLHFDTTNGLLRMWDPKNYLYVLFVFYFLISWTPYSATTVHGSSEPCWEIVVKFQVVVRKSRAEQEFAGVRILRGTSGSEKRRSVSGW